MAKTREMGIETHCIHQSLPKRRRKEFFNRRIGITHRSLGTREIAILPIRETDPIDLGPSST